jgi:lysozyme
MIVERMSHMVANLQKEEGFSAHAYQDHLGVWTIGHGRNIDKERGGLGISLDEAEILLRSDIRRAAIELEHRLPWVASVELDRREALVELAFQLGVPRLLKFRKMLAALEAGDFARASAELLDSKYATQTPARAQRYADRLRG